MGKAACVFIGVCLSCSLSGCSMDDAVSGVNDTYEYFSEQDGTVIYPEGLCENGKEIFGDGSAKAENDIFTVIENKIWGEKSDQ